MSSIGAAYPHMRNESVLRCGFDQRIISSMPSETAATPVAPHGLQDFMPLNGVDHVEFFVGNAKQAAFFYTRAYGFKLVAYSGLETGARDRASYVLQQGRIRLVLTGALHSDSPIAEHHRHHGDGVKVIALSVPDVDHAWHEATTRGAEGVVAPHDSGDEHGTVRMATIKTYGETLHTFVARTPACSWPSITSSATSSTWIRGSPSTRTSST